MRRWTDETDREAAELYPTFTLAKIRRYQSLAEQQIAMAREQRNDDAIADLQCMQDALTRELFRRAWPRPRRAPARTSGRQS